MVSQLKDKEIKKYDLEEPCEDYNNCDIIEDCDKCKYLKKYFESSDVRACFDAIKKEIKNFEDEEADKIIKIIDKHSGLGEMKK